MDSNKKLVLLVGGAAAVAAGLWCLFQGGDAVDDERVRREQLKAATTSSAPPSAAPVDELTKVKTILKEIAVTQETMKDLLKTVTVEVRSKNLSFEACYEKVRAVQPEDPLEKAGMTHDDLDQLLNQHQGDQEVQQGIMQLMGAGLEKKDSDMSVDTLIDCHKTMLKELQAVIAHVAALPNRSQYDAKIVTVVAQAIVAAKVEEQHGVSSEAIEQGVMKHHLKLGADKTFTQINADMQMTMQQLMVAS